MADPVTQSLTLDERGPTPLLGCAYGDPPNSNRSSPGRLRQGCDPERDDERTKMSVTKLIRRRIERYPWGRGIVYTLAVALVGLLIAALITPGATAARSAAPA